jgi:hypothetical protein
MWVELNAVQVTQIGRTNAMKKLIVIGLIAIATMVSIITLAYAQSSVNPAFRVIYNLDRPGADIRPGFASNLGGCMNNCASSSQCRTFTWVPVRKQPPNLDNAEPLCWLKNAVPRSRRSQGMVTGVKDVIID